MRFKEFYNLFLEGNEIEGTRLYTVQRIADLSKYDFSQIGANENGIAALGPAIYLSDSINLIKGHYVNRGMLLETALSNDAFIVDILSTDQNHWKKVLPKYHEIAKDLGYESRNAVPDKNVSPLMHGRGFIGQIVKLVGMGKARELLVKHGIHGAKEELPSGAYEYGIYDPSKLVNTKIINIQNPSGK